MPTVAVLIDDLRSQLEERGNISVLVFRPSSEGHVEEVWLGPTDQPLALALRTTDGRRALLLGEQVRTVERHHRWVVAHSRPALLELDAPRLTAADKDGGAPGKLWRPTSQEFQAESERFSQLMQEMPAYFLTAGPDSVWLVGDVAHRGTDEMSSEAVFTLAEGERASFVLAWHPSHEDAPDCGEPAGFAVQHARSECLGDGAGAEDSPREFFAHNSLSTLNLSRKA